MTPDALGLDKMIREVLIEGRANFHNLGKGIVQKKPGEPSTSGEIFVFWWQIFMASLLCAFFISCISHFAQYYQMILDQEESNLLRKKLSHKVREELSSPISGRLKLPPPSSIGSGDLIKETDIRAESCTNEIPCRKRE